MTHKTDFNKIRPVLHEVLILTENEYIEKKCCRSTTTCVFFIFTIFNSINYAKKKYFKKIN